MRRSPRLSVMPDLASSTSFPQAEGGSEGPSPSGTLKIPPNSETTLVLVGKSSSPCASYSSSQGVSPLS